MSRHARGYTVRGGGSVPIRGLSKASAKNMTSFAKGTSYGKGNHGGGGFPCLVVALALAGIGAIGVGLFGASLMWLGLV